jgi:hypothetical protein
MTLGELRASQHTTLHGKYSFEISVKDKSGGLKGCFGLIVLETIVKKYLKNRL